MMLCSNSAHTLSMEFVCTSPKNLADKTDAEIAVQLFGPRAKRALDGVAEAARRKSIAGA